MSISVPPERGVRSLSFGQAGAEGGFEHFAVQVRERPFGKAEGEPFRHEHLPRYMVLFIERLVAVLFVADDGMADKRHVRADLVRFAAVQANLHAGVFAEAFPDRILRLDALRTRAWARKYADVCGFFVLFEVRRQHFALLYKRVKAQRLVDFFRPPLAEGGKQFALRRGVQGERHKPARVAVEPVDEPRAELRVQGAKQSLRIDARVLIGDEDILVAVYRTVKRARFLPGRCVVNHLVARRKGHVAPDFFAVHAHVLFP